MASPFALLKGLEPEEEDALVGAGAVEAGAVDDRGVGHVIFFTQHLGDLHAELFCFHQGSAVLQLKNAQAVALVFIGDEGGGQGGEGEAGEHDANGQSA